MTGGALGVVRPPRAGGRCHGLFAAGLWVAVIATAMPAELVSRPVPRPAAHHPGNIFLAGEEVVVNLPGEVSRWRLTDYDGQQLREVMPEGGRAGLGRLPVGFYRLTQAGRPEWVSVGVLAPLTVPTPATSPIALDVAMAWFYPTGRMTEVSGLCALAGVNWVRDRLNWVELEPKRADFAGFTRYDASASAQHQAGLRVLQVIHHSPGWANPNGKRFPLDLRDAYRFFETMARRWRGQVIAFEPWNEADIPMFGGHTGTEMAAMQKAAYLGLKAGNPDMIVCLNVFALHRANQLADLEENEAWPYFDTYNLHHYEPFDRLPSVYADHRAVSAGRPVWVSECAVPVPWAGDERLKEPTDHDLRVQAERVAKTFASSLHERSEATFYFLLPHYVEGKTQFGVLRPDLTPRPAFVALAAVGRLLADARPLGRLRHDDVGVRGYLFEARPDGAENDVLVVWTTNREASLRLPLQPAAMFDHLGRVQEAAVELKVTSAPRFVLLLRGHGRSLSHSVAPAVQARLTGVVSRVVLQALWPEEKLDLNRSAYRVSAEQAERIPVWAYNFGVVPVRGTLQVEGTSGWQFDLEKELSLAPQERKELAVVVRRGDGTVDRSATLRVWGDFGPAGRPVLSLRLTAEAK